MKTTHKEIALVDKLDILKPGPDFGDTPEISVCIAKLADDGQSPRNFSLDYETPKSSTGGCHARIFAHKHGEGTDANLFSYYGPNVNFGDLNDYHHGARALERIAKKMDSMRLLRGNPVDAADQMGRWLECCGIEKVWMRPESSKREGWMNRGEWQQVSIGAFVNIVRSNLYIGPVKQTEAATA